MNFTLNNEHRKYMGLQLVEENWELVKYRKKEFEEYYVYFDKNKIRKVIKYFISNTDISIEESDVDYDTIENRTMVLPKTSRGKIRKLNGTTIDSFSSYGNYLYIHCNLKNENTWIVIGNRTNQRTYFMTNTEKCTNFNDIKLWCDKFVNESTEKDIEDVQKFLNEPRKNIKYKEGDYFVFKLGRREYGYGRLLFDLVKFRKEKDKYKDKLEGFGYMGTPLLVRVFKIISKSSNLSIDEIEKCGYFPSEVVLDNKLFYNDWKIIGNRGMNSNEIDYFVQFGYTSSAISNKVYLQKGFKYLEMEYEDVPEEIKEYCPKWRFDFKKDYKMGSIGFELNIERYLDKFRELIKNKEDYYQDNDLRSPNNKHIKEKIYKSLNIDWD